MAGACCFEQADDNKTTTVAKIDARVHGAEFTNYHSPNR
jgi:hypothetical protein